MGAATPAHTASKDAVLAVTRELAIVQAKENIPDQRALPRPAPDDPVVERVGIVVA